MRFLQMLLFWFMSFTNEINRIRDKKICFDVWLGHNPHTRHTSRIHGARCNFEELRGTSDMSEVPPLLLGKRAMTSSLSQSLFYHLQVNGKWLTILESLKEKEKCCSYELTHHTTKGYSLCGVHPGLLPQTSLGDLFLLSSSFLSLPFRWCSCLKLALASFSITISTFFYHAYMFNS